jgi:hypothetical protein
MDTLKLPSDVWAAGVSLSDYAATMTKYQEPMLRRLGYVALRPQEVEQVRAASKVRSVLALTEDWCGDSVTALPVVSQMVAALPEAELRVARRSDHEAWNAHFVERSLIHVPVITFFDADGLELGTWNERPQIEQDLFEAWKEARPDYRAIRYADDIDPDEQKKLLEPYYAQLLEDMISWYDGEQNMQQATIDEILAAITT